MNDHLSGEKYQSIAQRAAGTYARMLAEFCPVPSAQADAGAQADLHAFFQQLYARLGDDPAAFGLPLVPDASLRHEHDKEGPDKAALNRMLAKPRQRITELLDVLEAFGRHGRLEDGALVLADGPAAPLSEVLQKKTTRGWLDGLASAGARIRADDGGLRLESEAFPDMLPALQALAQACAACPDPGLGRVFFARCDLRALRGDFSLDPLDLYRAAPHELAARVAALHEFFLALGYRPALEIRPGMAWIVKYQGRRSVKSSPLFQVWYDERITTPVLAGIKCASAQRVVPLLEGQSQALRDDFARRVNNCFACGWCANKKAFGPVAFTHRGETRKLCWYVNYDIETLDDPMVELVREYALMHEQLA